MVLPSTREAADSRCRDPRPFRPGVSCQGQAVVGCDERQARRDGAARPGVCRAHAAGRRGVRRVDPRSPAVRAGIVPYEQEAVAVLNFLARQRQVDRGRLAVFGHSQGGSMRCCSPPGWPAMRPRSAVGLLEPVPICFLDVVGHISIASLTRDVQNGQLTAAQARAASGRRSRRCAAPAPFRRACPMGWRPRSTATAPARCSSSCRSTATTRGGRRHAPRAQLVDVGAALVPPLVQVVLVLIRERRPPVPGLGQQLIGFGGAVEAADGLLGEPGLAHDRLMPRSWARSACTCS